MSSTDQLAVTLTVSQLRGVVADAVRQALTIAPSSNGMRDQRGSPLGPKRHAACVRRRLAAGEPGAARVGRRWLLSEAALAEELARLGTEPDAEPSNDPIAQLKADLAR